MNSNTKVGRPWYGPTYCIEYWRGDRMLRDSGKSLEDAKRRIEQRLAKRHNRGERAIVRYKNEIVFETPY